MVGDLPPAIPCSPGQNRRHSVVLSSSSARRVPSTILGLKRNYEGLAQNGEGGKFVALFRFETFAESSTKDFALYAFRTVMEDHPIETMAIHNNMVAIVGQGGLFIFKILLNAPQSEFADAPPSAH